MGKSWPQKGAKYKNIKRTPEVLLTEFTKLLERAKTDTNIVYKKSLCIEEDYVWETIYETYRIMEEWEVKDNIFVIIKKIESIIANRLFHWGLTDKFNASLVRLYMSSQEGMNEKTIQENRGMVATVQLTWKETPKELEDMRKNLLQ